MKYYVIRQKMDSIGGFRLWKRHITRISILRRDSVQEGPMLVRCSYGVVELRLDDTGYGWDVESR